MTILDARSLLRSVFFGNDPTDHRDPETLNLLPKVIEACNLIRCIEIEGTQYFPVHHRSKSGLDSLIFEKQDRRVWERLSQFPPNTERPDILPNKVEAKKARTEEERNAEVILTAAFYGQNLHNPSPREVDACNFIDCITIDGATYRPRFVSMAPYTDNQRIVFERTFGGIEMIWCASGTFQMGEGEETHQVSISKGFWISKYPCTQKQWARMDTNRRIIENPDEPFEDADWYDCQIWLQKMNKFYPGPPGTVWALPTEAQWEYACRAGSETRYCFGNDESHLGDFAWYEGNSENGITVGTRRPNAWGIHDMHGLCYEWCQDWAGEYPAGPVSDPTGPKNGTERIAKGGEWEAEFCTSGDRTSWPPDEGLIGFRPILLEVGISHPKFSEEVQAEIRERKEQRQLLTEDSAPPSSPGPPITEEWIEETIERRRQYNPSIKELRELEDELRNVAHQGQYAALQAYSRSLSRQMKRQSAD